MRTHGVETHKQGKKSASAFSTTSDFKMKCGFSTCDFHTEKAQLPLGMQSMQDMCSCNFKHTPPVSQVELLNGFWQADSRDGGALCQAQQARQLCLSLGTKEVQTPPQRAEG